MENESDETFTGTVAMFMKGRGFGFIQPEGTSAKKEQVFVHWADCKFSSDMNYPFLKKGMEVSYKTTDKKGKTTAVKVTNTDGTDIHIEEQQKDCSIESYKGSIKFFDMKKGFGFITVDEKVSFGDHTAEPGDDENNGIYFTRMDIVGNAERTPQMPRRGTEVMFHLAADDKGLSATKITDAEGNPLKGTNNKRKRKGDGTGSKEKRQKTAQVPVDELEEDVDLSQTFTGTVKFWNIGRGFGWINPTDGELEFKETGEKTDADGIYFHKSSIETDHDRVKMPKGTEVEFNLYKDQRGFGAKNVVKSDGSAFEEAPPRPPKKGKKKTANNDATVEAVEA